MYFRFTLFNSATLGVMLLTGGMIWARFRFGLETTSLLLCYVPIALYGLTFRDSLSGPWVIGGTVCGALLRFEFMGGFVLKGVRALEMLFFAYLLRRCTVVLLLWPW
jgi:hypothetical protein